MLLLIIKNKLYEQQLTSMVSKTGSKIPITKETSADKKLNNPIRHTCNNL